MTLLFLNNVISMYDVHWIYLRIINNIVIFPPTWASKTEIFMPTSCLYAKFIINLEYAYKGIDGNHCGFQFTYQMSKQLPIFECLIYDVICKYWSFTKNGWYPFCLQAWWRTKNIIIMYLFVITRLVSSLMLLKTMYVCNLITQNLVLQSLST